MKIKFIYILQEIAIVVVGVLIAVSIGNYKEKADNLAYIDKTLLAIESEIEVNQAEIDSVLNRHITLYQTIQEEDEENEQVLGEVVSSAGGLQIASLKNVGLRFFVSNKAELLDFGMISKLIDIETKTNLLAKSLDRLADFAYDNVNKADRDVKIRFNYLLANVIDGEQTLLESYETFIKENDAYLSHERK